MENSDYISKDEAIRRYRLKAQELSSEALSRFEEKEKRLRELRETNKNHILIAAGLSLSVYGFTQVKYELHLQTVKLNDLHDPLLEPLFEFYDHYHTLPSGVGDIRQFRQTETRVLEASRDRLNFRQNANIYNPISLKDWEAFLYGQTLDNVINRNSLTDPCFKDYYDLRISRERGN